MAEDTIYLTVAPNPKGPGVLAVMSLGSPQKDDQNITVLTLEVLDDAAAARDWFERMKVEQPWIKRN